MGRRPNPTKSVQKTRHVQAYISVDAARLVNAFAGWEGISPGVLVRRLIESFARQAADAVPCRPLPDRGACAHCLTPGPLYQYGDPADDTAAHLPAPPILWDVRGFCGRGCYEMATAHRQGYRDYCEAGVLPARHPLRLVWSRVDAWSEAPARVSVTAVDRLLRAAYRSGWLAAEMDARRAGVRDADMAPTRFIP